MTTDRYPSDATPVKVDASAARTEAQFQSLLHTADFLWGEHNDGTNDVRAVLFIRLEEAVTRALGWENEAHPEGGERLALHNPPPTVLLYAAAANNERVSPLNGRGTPSVRLDYCRAESGAGEPTIRLVVPWNIFLSRTAQAWCKLFDQAVGDAS